MPCPEEREILEHPLREGPPGSGLNLDVDEKNLLHPLTGANLGDDVRSPGASLGKAREGLGVQELQLREVDLGFDLGKEKLQKIPQELSKELLEPLIVPHGLVLPERTRRKMGGRSSPGSLLLDFGESFFDLGLEGGELLGAADEADPVHLGRVGRIGAAEDEARSSGCSRFLRLRRVLSHRFAVLLRGHAGLEGDDVEPERFHVSLQRLDGALVGEEEVVHLPELPLVFGAVGREGGPESVLVDRERHVHLDQTELSGLYELFFDLCRRLTGVPGAERSLIVGELDEGEFGRCLSAIRIASHVENQVPHVGSREACSGFLMSASSFLISSWPSSALGEYAVSRLLDGVRSIRADRSVAEAHIRKRARDEHPVEVAVDVLEGLNRAHSRRGLLRERSKLARE